MRANRPRQIYRRLLLLAGQETGKAGVRRPAVLAGQEERNRAPKRHGDRILANPSWQSSFSFSRTRKDAAKKNYSMANDRLSAGDGGHTGPCDHTFDDGAHSGGEYVAGSSEDIPTCNELSAGSMPGISNDEPTAETPARGSIFDAGGLHAPDRLVQLGLVRMDETAASGFRTASVMTDPTREGTPGETSIAHIGMAVPCSPQSGVPKQ
ncbi:hypothetical protein B0H14DRAFT_2606650 [Mycena olivaceomarginata]|nr:hypothetical protein B0H14DRAFT_2606650 [Mycena olivaceomarginata]